MNKAMDLKDHILCDLYFVTSTVVDWVDIFTRPKYKHIVGRFTCLLPAT